MKLYQVLVADAARTEHDRAWTPRGSAVFTSIEDARELVSHLGVRWINPEDERIVCDSLDGIIEAEDYGIEDRRCQPTQFLIRELSFQSDSAVVVPVEKIRAMQEIVDRMSARLDAYPGQTAQQIADHKMDGDL